MSAFQSPIREDRYLVLVEADDDVVELLTIASNDRHMVEAILRSKSGEDF